MVNPHQYSTEIHELLKKYPFSTPLVADDFELLPLYHIDTALSILCDRKNLKHRLAVFRTTYLLEDFMNLSMCSLLERVGVNFIENLIKSLKGLIVAYETEKT